MRNSNKLVALAIVLCTLVLQMPNPPYAFAEYQGAEQQQEQTKNEDEYDNLDDGIALQNDSIVDLSLNISAPGFVENSFRYQNGQPIPGVNAISSRSLPHMPEGVTGWGIDVSRHQGVIDWAKVKAAGVDFAILRCGYGTDGTDGQFKANVEGCKKNNIPFGVYLYSYAWDADVAREEANWTLDLMSSAGVKPSDLKLPVYYDLENTVGNKNHPDYGKPAGVDGNNQYHVIKDNATFTAMAKAYCSVIESAGYQPGVYASLNWWRTYLTDGSFNSWDRWVAQYYTECTYQGSYSFWQYSSAGSVDGISGNVDMNYCYASFKNLGWYKENGTWYYGQFDGTNRTGWLSYKGSWYWLDPNANGAMATGVTEIDGKRYFLDPVSDGIMKTGWISFQGKRYYAASSGVLYEGWKKMSGSWYHFDTKGSCELTTGWLLDGAAWYYFSSSGVMQTGWHKLGDLWYYLDSSGAMKTGWLSLGGSWYYLNPGSGAMATGWVKVDNVWYYLKNSGVMAKDWLKLGTTWYYLEKSGAMATGWAKVGNSWYYFNGSGAMAVGWKKVGDTWYYLEKSGAMATNRWIGNYYVTGSGAMATNCWIGRYHVNASGLWDATR